MTMPVFRRHYACLLFSVLAFPVSAAPDLPPIMPAYGQWQITTSMPPEQKAAMQGMDANAQKAMARQGMSVDLKAGTMTMQMCLNKQTIKDWHRQGERAGHSSRCEAPRYAVGGNTLTMDLKCGAPRPMTMHSVYQFSPARDSYTFEHRMQGEGQTMHMNGKAQRIGDC
ncbi:DUF3617 domain-containing protein [Chitinilyticum litopenaei]|uniref:DUF3617 domain-containing protein n=1 Tax=Chitinilyticum litopenaei TaxID=1121276 RepID=UPI00041DF0C8|nr:DUF3617 family protein [Chitinilyticum litopenaei]